MRPTREQSGAVMAVELEAFLSAFPPRFICLSCLRQATSRKLADVQRALNRLLAERRIEARVEECLNCNSIGLALRRR
jgi:hypothetical protein